MHRSNKINFCYDRQENEEQETNLHLYLGISSFIKFLSSFPIEPSKRHVVLLLIERAIP